MGVLGNFFGGKMREGSRGSWNFYLFLKKQECKGPLWTHTPCKIWSRARFLCVKWGMGVLGNFFGGKMGEGSRGSWKFYLFLKKQECKGPLWTHVLNHGIASG